MLSPVDCGPMLSPVDCGLDDSPETVHEIIASVTDLGRIGVDRVPGLAPAVLAPLQLCLGDLHAGLKPKR
jgi:hypothetical protein